MAMLSTDQWINAGCSSVMAFRYHHVYDPDTIKITLLPKPNQQVIFHKGGIDLTPHGSWWLDPDHGKLSLQYKNEVGTEIFQVFLQQDGGADIFQCIDSNTSDPSMVTLVPWQEDLQCHPDTMMTVMALADDPSEGYGIGHRDCIVLDPGVPQPDDFDVLLAFVACLLGSMDEDMQQTVMQQEVAFVFIFRMKLDQNTKLDDQRKLRLWELYDVGREWGLYTNGLEKRASSANNPVPGIPQPDDDFDLMQTFVTRVTASIPGGGSIAAFFGSTAVSEFFLRLALDCYTEMDRPQKLRVWDLMQKTHRVAGS